MISKWYNSEMHHLQEPAAVAATEAVTAEKKQ